MRGRSLTSIAADDPDAVAMQIAPRTLWCANAWRLHAGVNGRRFEELQELCDRAGDKTSPAIAMTGLLAEGVVQGRIREASQLAAEHSALLESIADPTLMVGLAVGTIGVRVVTGEIQEVLRWSDTVIDLAHDDPVNRELRDGLSAGHRVCNPKPRAMVPRVVRDGATTSSGRSSWPATVTPGRERRSCSTPSAPDRLRRLMVDDAARREIDDAHGLAEAAGDDLGVSFTKYTKGLLLLHGDSGRPRPWA